MKNAIFFNVEVGNLKALEDLSGKQSDLVAQYSKLRAELKKAKSDLDKANNALQKNTKDTSKNLEAVRVAAKRHNELNREVQVTRTALKSAGKQLTTMTSELAKSNAVAQNATKSYRGLKIQISAVEKEMRDLSVAGKSNSARFKELSKNLKSMRADVSKADRAIGKRGFSGSVGTALSARLLGFGGAVSAAAFAIQGLADIAKDATNKIIEFDERVADLSKVTDLSSDAARNLAKAVSTIDTRTSVQGLLDLAVAGGRIGLTSVEIEGFVRSADKLFVALGDTLEGSSQEIALEIGKIAQVFGIIDDLGVEEGLLAVGSVINTLGANTAATEPAMLDFINRMSGTAKSAGIAYEEVAALGAFFDSAGQSIEIAATTFQRLIPEIGKNVERFSSIAGVTAEKFIEISENSPIDAILAVAEGARDEGAEGLLKLTSVLESYNIENARATTVATLLSSETETLRQQLELARNAYILNESVTLENAKKQNTLRAAIENTDRAYESLVLSIDDGSGVLSQTLSFFQKFEKQFYESTRALNENKIGWIEWLRIQASVLGNSRERAIAEGVLAASQASDKKRQEQRNTLLKNELEILKSSIKSFDDFRKVFNSSASSLQIQTFREVLENSGFTSEQVEEQLNKVKKEVSAQFSDLAKLTQGERNERQSIFDTLFGRGGDGRTANLSLKESLQLVKDIEAAFAKTGVTGGQLFKRTDPEFKRLNDILRNAKTNIKQLKDAFGSELDNIAEESASNIIDIQEDALEEYIEFPKKRAAIEREANIERLEEEKSALEKQKSARIALGESLLAIDNEIRRKQLEIDKARIEDVRVTTEEEEKIRKDNYQKGLDLIDSTEEIQLLQLRNQYLSEAEGKSLEERKTLLENYNSEVLVKQRQFQDDRVKLAEDYNDLEGDILRKALQRRNDLIEKHGKERAKIIEKTQQAALDALDDEQDAERLAEGQEKLNILRIADLDERERQLEAHGKKVIKKDIERLNRRLFLLNLFGQDAQKVLEAIQQLELELAGEGKSGKKDDDGKPETLGDNEVAAFTLDSAKKVFNALADAELDAIERVKDARLASLDEEFDKRLAEVEGQEELENNLLKQKERKRRDIEKQAAKEKKRVRVKEAVIEGALAVIRAIPDFAKMAFAASASAIQIATIKSQKFEKGGKIDSKGNIIGASHSNGGVNAVINGRSVEVEGGERADYDENGNAIIINKKSNAMFKSTLDSINGKSFSGKGSILSRINSFNGYGVPLAQDGIKISGRTPAGIVNLVQTSNETAMMRKVFQEGLSDLRDELSATVEGIRDSVEEATERGTERGASIGIFGANERAINEESLINRRAL